ncbi:MAG: isochorismatase family protein [Chlamydiae bacterium]|nr:isochorismatase family protein [Chlamydiota bacterium]MBI3277117.1 isochorismatase family protein [Chlamydiota bacterium]
MTETVDRHCSILMTQCLQCDFVKPIGRFDSLPNLLHVGHEEAKRLLGEKIEEGPVHRVMDWAHCHSNGELKVIHIRDWHDPDDPDQISHLKQFGNHCLKNSQGAAFVFPLSPPESKNVSIVSSLTLNDFQGTDLEKLLNPYRERPTRVGLMGVWTEAKITYLAYELRTRYPNFEIAVCSALTASSSRSHHFLALEQLHRLLGVIVHASIGEFIKFLGGKEDQISLPISHISDHPILMLDDASMALSQTDQALLKYLFRDCKTVQFKYLDGGFSGNIVLGTQSEDLYGHKQASHVIKIGSQQMIGRERASFEKIETVLGNNAPHVADFADYNERGAIKYRYASMGGGFSTTFQKMYCAGLSLEKTKRILKFVFSEQLGRFYQAATREKVNLLKYYEYNLPDLGSRIRKRVEAVLGFEVKGEVIDFFHGSKIANICLFYEKEIPLCLPLCEGSTYMAYVHGDLNGANIIVDDHENVWLIDFFHTHRGHVLKDLIKIENDVLYIFTPVRNEQEFKEALTLTDQLLKVEDLAAPLPEFDIGQIRSPQFKRAWETIQILRSFYPSLIHADRSPLQLWVGQLRYAMHTLSFDESNLWQKRWALYTGSICAKLISDQLKRSGPLRIDWMNPGYWAGRLGITILPGRRDYGRFLEDDLATIKNEQVGAILCLVTLLELQQYGVGDLLSNYTANGISLKHFPIVDQRICSAREMKEAIAWIKNHLKMGKNVVIHCVGGLGRSGLVAACFLKSCGLSTDEALDETRRVRSKRAIETTDQEEFVRNFDFRKGIS